PARCRPFIIAIILGMTIALTSGGSRLRLATAATPLTCEQAGFQNVSRTDGSHFSSLLACLSYTAQGGTLVLLPDLVLHTTCDTSGLPQRVACSFTATNAGPAPLVTTTTTPVVFQGLLAVLNGLDTAVDAEVTGNCPLNVSWIT